MKDLIDPLERIKLMSSSLLANTDLTFSQEQIVQSIDTVTQTLYELVISIPDLTWDKAREMLSFETRSHLASIIGYAELLLDDAQDGLLTKAQHTHVKSIRDDGKLLLHRLTQFEKDANPPPADKGAMVARLNQLADTLLESVANLLNDGLAPNQQDDIGKIESTTQTFKERLSQMPTNEVLTARYRHDLRSPLNSMIGFAELLLFEEGHDFSENQRDQLGIIRKATLSIIETLDKLLAE